MRTCVLSQSSLAVDMISKEAVSPDKDGKYRALLCVGVEDVDAVYKTLSDKGVAFIKPPKSQAWGRRTTYFADPEGNLWELWQSIAPE